MYMKEEKAKVGGPQINPANRKSANCRFLDLDYQTFRKCFNVRICGFVDQVIFENCGFAIVMSYFADLKLPHIHNLFGKKF
jgi:hypothetical protein